jgi:hypothetical protein
MANHSDTVPGSNSSSLRSAEPDYGECARWSIFNRASEGIFAICIIYDPFQQFSSSYYSSN